MHKDYHKARKQKEKNCILWRERDVSVMTECEGDLVAQRQRADTDSQHYVMAQRERASWASQRMDDTVYLILRGTTGKQ